MVNLSQSKILDLVTLSIRNFAAAHMTAYFGLLVRLSYRNTSGWSRRGFGYFSGAVLVIYTVF
jgi:hypothetical protein